MKKVISILTATRAEYGLLKPLIEKLSGISDFDTRVVVTGMHLSPSHGLTYRDIERDGIRIDKKIEILLSSGSEAAVSKAMGLAMISFAEYFEERKPDLFLVLGDRFETMAACIAAMNARIPIAHLHGGESTEGLIDEAIRHSITKMSYLHFTSTEEYRKRVIQLGEEPNRVFHVGAIGIEVIKHINYMTREELEQSIDFDLSGKFALLTFHPVTLEQNSAKEQFENLLQAMDAFGDIRWIITKANADMGGSVINKMIDNYVCAKPQQCIAFEAMGQRRYLSAMKYCEFVIGNSSSGIIETPTFRIPTINIGDRQKGRIQAKSVINCKPVKKDIIDAVKLALSPDFRDSLDTMVNPYGDGMVSDKIVAEIKRYFSGNRNLKKQFYQL